MNLAVYMVLLIVCLLHGGQSHVLYLSISSTQTSAWYVIAMHEHVHVRVYMWVTVYKR